MFNLKTAQKEGRELLALPTKGRLDQEQQDKLTTYCKKEYTDYLIENGIILKPIGKVALGASYPVNHPKRVERSTGLKKAKLSLSKYTSNGGPGIESLLNLEFHEGVEVREVIAVAARPADGMETRGRKSGSKNRDKATIQAEKAAKAIRTEARMTLGFPNRGRLTEEQKKQLEEYVEKHSD